MARAETKGVTQLLLAWRDGDESALDKLTPIVYGSCTGSHAAAWPESASSTRFRRRPS
jgi:hypothetical protein